MRVLCTLPNAAAVINGVNFEPVDAGMLSEDVPAEVAAHFLSIPGYRQPKKKEAPPVPSADPASEGTP